MTEKKLQIICNTDKYKNFKKGEDVTNYVFAVTREYSDLKRIKSNDSLNTILKDKTDIEFIGLKHPKTHNCQYYLAKNFIFK